MKKMITYKQRASFYNSELIIDDNLEKFLLYTRNAFNLQDVILIPCGAGKYKDIYGKIFKKSYFNDCEKEMISQLKSECNYNNIIPRVGNLKDEIKINVDAVFVLNQGMQFLSYLEFKRFICNYSKHTKYFILDLFDFFKNSNDGLNYYSIIDNEINSTFYHNGKLVKRNITYYRYKDKINFLYTYNNNYQMKFNLYNYKYEDIMQILKTIPNLVVKCIYADYSKHFYNDNNRFILILEVING